MFHISVRSDFNILLSWLRTRHIHKQPANIDQTNPNMMLGYTDIPRGTLTTLHHVRTALSGPCWIIHRVIGYSLPLSYRNSLPVSTATGVITTLATSNKDKTMVVTAVQNSMNKELATETSLMENDMHIIRSKPNSIQISRSTRHKFRWYLNDSGVIIRTNMNKMTETYMARIWEEKKAEVVLTINLTFSWWPPRN